MKILKGEFATVPLKSTRGESPNVQTVYFRICGYANEDGICFPSIRELSEASGMSQDSARRSIKRLVEIGLLLKKTQVRDNGSQTSNEYEVFTLRGEAFESVPPLAHSDPHPGSQQGAPLAHSDPHNNTIKNQTILTEKDSKESKREIVLEIIESGFSEMQNVAYDPEYERNPELVEKLKEFLAFRKAKRVPIMPESFAAFLKKLTKLSGGRSEAAIEILDESIANGWTGIFALKDGQYAANSKVSPNKY